MLSATQITKVFTSCNKYNRRHFSVAVDLRSTVLSPKNNSDLRGEALLLHGILGNRNNWRAVARRLADDTKCIFHVLDLRNHGESPQTSVMSYHSMIVDVLHYVERYVKHRELAIIGHSMGGRVAMQLCLNHPHVFNKLAVVDISPVVYPSFTHMGSLLKCMLEMDTSALRSREEADRILQALESDAGVRQFLLTNLIPTDDNQGFKWRLNLAAIRKFLLHELPSFPIEDGAKYGKPTLFLAGIKSNYVQQHHLGLINSLFPKNKVEVIQGAGHWLHADKPEEVIRHISTLLLANLESK